MRIAVYGATGFTGTLVAHLLSERGAELVLSGRHRRRLEVLGGELSGPVEVRPAEVHDDSALQGAIAGAEVVINCAGPFSLIGEPVVRAAIAAQVPYLDVAGEQHFLRDIYERYESRARRAGVAVVNGIGFEVALGDWSTAIAAGALDEPLDEIAVGYAVNRFRPTRGTRLSALEGMRGPASVWTGDRWDPDVPARRRRAFAFPALGERSCVSFPSGEVITVPRHVEVGRVETYLGISGDSTVERLAARAAPLLRPAAALLARTPVADSVRALLESGPATPSDSDRDDTVFAIAAEARRGFDSARVSLWGRDIYGVTAEILAWAAAEMAGAARPAGVLAPAEAFDPQQALATVAERCRLEISRSFP